MRPIVPYFVGLLLAVAGLVGLIAAADRGDVVYVLKVNPLTRPGKVVVGVDNDHGYLEHNILDNVFFRERLGNDHLIFLVGSSMAWRLPPLRFRYRGESYQTYSFGIGSVSFIPPLKLLSILSQFHPEAVFLAFSPVHVGATLNLHAQPFGRECLGSLARYGFARAELGHEDRCDYGAGATHSQVPASSLIAALTHAALGRQATSPADLQLMQFRSLLASVAGDLRSSIRHTWGRAPAPQPPIDLGDLSESGPDSQGRIAALQRATSGDRGSMPTSQYGADSEVHWRQTRDLNAMNPGQTLDRLFADVRDFAANANMRLVVFNSPSADDASGIYPPGFYRDYRQKLAALMARQHVAYVDAGDLFPYDRKFMEDFIHLTPAAGSVLAQRLVLEATDKHFF